ncbi:MAG: glycosyltransferase [Actinomycetia bacterium]|nr:glycosyltransferase [Actinomycetes bacterium]
MLEKKEEKNRVLADTSFITTVYNEEGSILEFLESLKVQTRLPSEMIIVDGGSEDRTFEMIQGFFADWAREERDGKIKIYLNESGGRDPVTVRLIRKEGAGISLGRNTAITNASGRFISVSDAGCILDARWFEEINSGRDENSHFITGGMNYAAAGSFLQRMLALCIMPGLDELREDRFMPSSRNISFRRTGWEKAGGYPEDLDYGEDMKFNFNLKEKGYKLRLNPRAVVYWKMREDLSSVFRQFFRYAKGDALGRMYSARHLVRFLSSAIFIAIALMGIFISPWVFFALIVLAAIYSYKAYRRMFFRWKGNEGCRPQRTSVLPAMLCIPFLLLHIDTAKAFGYIYGFFKR